MLVLFVAFAAPITTSLYHSFFGYPGSTVSGNLRYLYMGIQETGAVLVLWYVLRRTDRSFSSIGFRVSLKGALSGVVLAVLGWLGYLLVIAAIQVTHRHYFGSYVATVDYHALLPKTTLAVLVPFVVLNSFYEEAIVRAYLMTEMSQLAGSMVLAAAASVVVQASYHTYQGWLAVSGASATFTVFSFYYARRRKLFPIYIAHVIYDLLAVTTLMAR